MKRSLADATIAEFASRDKNQIKRHAYRAYVLRCWQEGKPERGQTPHWRFSLEEILHERRRLGFDSLEKLVAFLEAQFGQGHGAESAECRE